jgi:hypothetical protein
MDDGLSGHTALSAPPSQPGSYSAHSLQPHNHRLSHNHRAASPPLEGDEKEFTQTASSVRERTSTEDISTRPTQDTVSASQTSDETSSAMEAENGDFDQSHTQDRDYDYFSSHFIQNQSQDQEVDAVAESDPFAASASPSAASDLSTISSSGSPASYAPVEGDYEPAESTENYSESAIKGASDVTVAAASAISVAKITSMHIDTGYTKMQMNITAFDNDPSDSDDSQRDDIEMNDPIARIKPVMGVNLLDHALESWGDLQSPETMDIHELDAIFGDI